jgi:hypothetical protein
MNTIEPGQSLTPVDKTNVRLKMVLVLVFIGLVSVVSFYFGVYSKEVIFGNNTTENLLAENTGTALPQTEETSKVTFRSYSTTLESQAFPVKDYAYVHYLAGPAQSVSVGNVNKSYGFNLQDETLQITDISQKEPIIATIDLEKFISKLINLKQARGLDPEGYGDYYSPEEMSFDFQNQTIKLKVYADHIEGYEDKGTFNLTMLTGLVLFTVK